MENKKFAEQLIKEYSTKENKKVDELKALDKKVKLPAQVFTYSFGIIGSLVLGVGMCLAMGIIGGTVPLTVLGIVVGLVGIAMVSVNYPLYSKILSTRKQNYASEIISKSNELLNK